MSEMAQANILRHSDASRRSISINIHLAILLKSRTIRALDDSRPGPWLARLLTAAVGPFHRGPTCLDTAFELLRQVNTYPSEKTEPESAADVTLSALGDYERSKDHVQEAIGLFGSCKVTSSPGSQNWGRI